jgi:Na+/melibiose symporter-like transporter
MNLKKIGNIFASIVILFLMYVLEGKGLMPKNTIKIVVFFLLTMSITWQILFYKGFFQKKHLKKVIFFFSCLLIGLGLQMFVNFKHELSLLGQTDQIINYLNILFIFLFLGIQIGISLEKSENTDKKKQ